jgi:NADH-quinone oxidoreductase subunit M
MPLVGAIVIAALPNREGLIKRAAMVFTLLTFALSLPLFAYNGGLLIGANGTVNAGQQFQFLEENRWLPELGINYNLGLDGVAMLLVLLTTFLQIFAVAISYTTIHERFKEYFISL